MLGNQEILTIISALGCAVGQDFNPEKLRYSRIIIMTDADVDGSHIRTLLLTFFFRQMQPLVQGGHLYIAQPPLYKVKRGKKERYLKDEHALDDFLLESGCKNLTVYTADGKLITGDEVVEIVDQIRKFAQRIHRSARRVVPEVADSWYAIDGHLIDRADKAAMTAVSKRLEEELAIAHPDLHISEISVVLDADLGIHNILVSTLRNGEERVSTLGGAREGERMVEAVKDLHSSLSLPAKLSEHGDEIRSWATLFSTIMATAKKGYEIQRYKGLGEMNPDQLWDTTMNPETRTLMQVGVDNMIQADHIFSVLMGDAVDPRRNFIQENALNVRNLDI
jgi:DNA gyrase subunit B